MFPTRVLRMPISATINGGKPIVGKLKKGLVLDLSMALGLGTTFGYFFWYGYHVPATRTRDEFYARIENERARKAGVS